MKFVKITVLFFAASIAFVSCKDKKDKDTKETTTETTKTAKELIVNTWKPVKVGDNDPATDSSLQLIAGTTYQFTADGKYIITGVLPEPFTIDYSVADDNKTIKLSGENAMSDKIEIDRISANELVLITSAGEKITYNPK